MFFLREKSYYYFVTTAFVELIYLDTVLLGFVEKLALRKKRGHQCSRVIIIVLLSVVVEATNPQIIVPTYCDHAD